MNRKIVIKEIFWNLGLLLFGFLLVFISDYILSNKQLISLLQGVPEETLYITTSSFTTYEIILRSLINGTYLILSRYIILATLLTKNKDLKVAVFIIVNFSSILNMISKLSKTLILFLLLTNAKILKAQDASLNTSPVFLHNQSTYKTDSLNKKRLKTLIIGGSSFYVASMTGLYFLWYANGEQQPFQFFDDNAQWKQVDKVGHFYSNYHYNLGALQAFRWTGMEEKKARLWSTVTSIGIMTSIEVFDGFSAEFGASWGDFVANTGGALFLLGQYALWDEVRLHPKFSFHQTSFAGQRPDVLGSGLNEEILKDYNGQTYWLSVDMDKFLPQKKFPKWLNIAFGYGAENMLYARDNENRELAQITPFRQYYLGLDWDLTAIKTKSKFLKTVLYFANMIRLPAPALEYNSKGEWKWHALYF